MKANITRRKLLFYLICPYTHLILGKIYHILDDLEKLINSLDTSFRPASGNIQRKSLAREAFGTIRIDLAPITSFKISRFDFFTKRHKSESNQAKEDQQLHFADFDQAGLKEIEIVQLDCFGD